MHHQSANSFARERTEATCHRRAEFDHYPTLGAHGVGTAVEHGFRFRDLWKPTILRKA